MNATINELNEHSDDFINIADQLSGRVAFPKFAMSDPTHTTAFHMSTLDFFFSLTAKSSSGSGPLCAKSTRQRLCRLVIRSVLTGEIECNAERGAKFVIARVPLSDGRV
jgi:hypothetical protein